jgi:hypothetical protein
MIFRPEDDQKMIRRGSVDDLRMTAEHLLKIVHAGSNHGFNRGAFEIRPRGPEWMSDLFDLAKECRRPAFDRAIELIDVGRAEKISNPLAPGWS